jgi:hypothetical protein
MREDIEIAAEGWTGAMTAPPRRGRAKVRAGATISSPAPNNSEIGAMVATTAKRVVLRGKRASSSLSAKTSALASQPTQIAAETPRRTRAGSLSTTRSHAPASEPIDGAIEAATTGRGSPPIVNAGANGDTRISVGSPRRSISIGGHIIDDGRDWHATEDARAAVKATPMITAPWHPSIPAIMRHQRIRRFAIQMTGRITRATESFIAAHDDFRELDRKAAFAEAKRVRLAIEKGATGCAQPVLLAPPAHSAVMAECAPIAALNHQSSAGWEAMRANAETEMRALARTLPVWAWSERVRGLGALGVAIIAAEASGDRGDVGSYATKERLWKRLGLAVIEGERQQRKAGDAALAHGYNPRRRAEIWAICSDSMFRHQWRGAKEDVPAHAIGPYGDVYARRREHTKDHDWPLGRKHNDALRVMTKALIEDYWRVWRGLPPLQGQARPEAMEGDDA